MFPGEISGLPTNMFPQVAMPRMPLSRQVQQMREWSLINRLSGYAGHGGMRYGGGGYRGAAGPGMDLSTGIDPSTMDMSAANSLLASFGQHMPDNPSPFAMFPNSGFWGNHPRITGALEGAIFGAANAGPADTWGEGINSIARSILGGQAERSRAINQQYMQPFQTASLMGSLMEKRQTLDENAARTQLYKNQADYYGDKGDLERQKISAQEQANLLREQANILRLQGSQTQREMSMSHLSQPVRDILAGQGINPWEAKPAQIEAARKQAYGEALNKAGVGANIGRGGADERQKRQQQFQADWDATKGQLWTDNSVAYKAYLRGGGEPGNWENARDTHNRQVLQGFQNRWGSKGAGDNAAGLGNSPLPGGSAAPFNPAAAADQAIADWAKARQEKNKQQAPAATPAPSTPISMNGAAPFDPFWNAVGNGLDYVFTHVGPWSRPSMSPNQVATSQAPVYHRRVDYDF